ncbi:MAG: bifunctional tetrahydrofolate synthase/dihydrofolate synthase [Porticoccaceae bacterium]
MPERDPETDGGCSTPPRCLEDWLTLIEARHPREIDLGLERIAQVAARLALPALARKQVVVAGTNGKGSCVRTLEAIALARGLRVGAYTSPHILSYNERLRLQGEPIGDEALCAAFAAVEAVRGDISLTYFEMGTLAAMHIMAAAALDLAILEVGMGGRFDAVNIVDADLAVITAIDIDHADWLGNSRDAIAAEKAGVARAGRPVVCCDPDPPPGLLTALAQVSAKLFFIGADFGAKTEAAERFDAFFCGPGGAQAFGALPVPRLPLPSVLAAIEAAFLLGYAPDHALLADVLTNVTLPGRFQMLTWRGKTLVLDVAHNPAAAAFLARRLADTGREVVAVAALMADKDRAGFIAALQPVVSAWCCPDLAVPRALPGAELAARVRAAGCRGAAFASVGDAVEKALAMCDKDGIIVACGSFHTISAVMKYIDASSPGGRHDL